jgi:YbbR domain-containing protein
MVTNLSLKAVSLVLAVVLWFVIAGERSSERGLTAPLELQNFPKDYELTGDLLDSVEVRLRASPGIIHRLSAGDVSAQIDLAGASEGEHIVHLTPQTIRVPFGVEVVKVTPSIVTLNFERTLQRTVPVRPRLLGRPPSGYEVAEITSDPPEVRIAGPKSRVQEIESAFTEPVSVDGAQASVTDSVTIGVDDPMLRLLGTSRARVTARVREVQQRRTFEKVAVGARDGGEVQVRPATVRVVVEGPASLVRRLRPEDVHPFVTVTGDASAPAKAKVSVDLGQEGVSVVFTEPAEVTVRPAASRRNP